jgi:hypothetical protein
MPEMSAHLYIISEGEDDEMFYERLAEQATGRSFAYGDEYRVRPGANWKSVLATSKLLLSRFKHWTDKQDIAVIIAVDNDRAPQHPGGRAYPRPLPALDQKKAPRYPAMQQMLMETLGPDTSKWPVDVALAVPVEMIESWVLTLLTPNRADLPPFAQASQKTARDYYGGQPPPQLKDLRDEETRARNLTRAELFWQAAEQPLEPAIQTSRSLAMFVEQLKSWR